MPHPLPLGLVLFTTTAGHFGRYDIYQTTVSHLERQCGGDLSNVFANRIAHIKVRPREAELARFPAMVVWLQAHGFTVIVAEEEWSRGLSMQHSYLGDIYRVAHFGSVQAQPYTLFLEDDSPINPRDVRLLDLLTRDCQTLAKDKDALCVRYARLGHTAELPEHDPHRLVSPWYHFQPHIVRSRDLMMAIKLIGSPHARFANCQCEMAFTIALRSLMGNDPAARFLVCKPEVAYAYDLGVEDYESARAGLG